MQEQEWVFPKLLPQEHSFAKMSLYAVAFTLPFNGTQGPSLNSEKQPQTIIPSPPSCTVGTMYSSVLLASAKPSFIHQTA